MELDVKGTEGFPLTSLFLEPARVAGQSKRGSERWVGGRGRRAVTHTGLPAEAPELRISLRSALPCPERCAPPAAPAVPVGSRGEHAELHAFPQRKAHKRWVSVCRTQDAPRQQRLKRLTDLILPLRISAQQMTDTSIGTGVHTKGSHPHRPPPSPEPPSPQSTRQELTWRTRPAPPASWAWRSASGTPSSRSPARGGSSRREGK